MELLALIGPLLALLPPWAANLIVVAVLACPAASAFTALVPTPATPDATGSRAHRLWWRVYRLIEAVALVNDRVKQNPDAARALASAARTLMDHSGATPLQQAAMAAVATHAPPQAMSVLAGVVSELAAPPPVGDRPVDRPVDAPLPVRDVAADLLALAGRLR